jgi:hypothetical protein
VAVTDTSSNLKVNMFGSCLSCPSNEVPAVPEERIRSPRSVIPWRQADMPIRKAAPSPSISIGLLPVSGTSRSKGFATLGLS